MNEVEEVYNDTLLWYQVIWAEVNFLQELLAYIRKAAGGSSTFEDAESSQLEIDAQHNTHEKIYDAEADVIMRERENLQAEISERMRQIDAVSRDRANARKITPQAVDALKAEVGQLRRALESQEEDKLTNQLLEVRRSVIEKECKRTEALMQEISKQIAVQQHIHDDIESIRSQQQMLDDRSERSAKEISQLLEYLQN